MAPYRFAQAANSEWRKSHASVDNPACVYSRFSDFSDNGFGYDPIVYLPEYGRTSGELAPEEKNKISHRGKALALIKEELDKSEELYAEDNDSK